MPEIFIGSFRTFFSGIRRRRQLHIIIGPAVAIADGKKWRQHLCAIQLKLNIVMPCLERKFHLPDAVFSAGAWIFFIHDNYGYFLCFRRRQAQEGPAVRTNLAGRHLSFPWKDAIESQRLFCNIIVHISHLSGRTAILFILFQCRQSLCHQFPGTLYGRNAQHFIDSVDAFHLRSEGYGVNITHLGSKQAAL